MNSTGNDIVALQATDWQRTISTRFYSRILAAGEQALFNLQALPGLPFDHFVWLLWSIKESVYKFELRARTGFRFSPVKIAVHRLTHDGGFYQGVVFHGETTFYSRSIIRDEVIVTVVSSDPNFARTRWGFEAIGQSSYAHQSASVRTLATAELSSAISRANLRIGKNQFGIPVICDGEEILDIPVSLAHHGRYVAWSFLLPAAETCQPTCATGQPLAATYQSASLTC
jgi:phosphopantetheinyl transferase (holo-ACP synthase)